MSATHAARAGLLLLSGWLVLAPPAGASAAPFTRLLIGVAFAAPLLALVYLSFRSVRQWGAWVAITLIPYFALSVGALLVTPDARLSGSAFATVVAVVFFTGILASRQRA